MRYLILGHEFLKDYVPAYNSDEGMIYLVTHPNCVPVTPLPVIQWVRVRELIFRDIKKPVITSMKSAIMEKMYAIDLNTDLLRLKYDEGIEEIFPEPYTILRTYIMQATNSFLLNSK